MEIMEKQSNYSVSMSHRKQEVGKCNFLCKLSSNDSIIKVIMHRNDGIYDFCHTGNKDSGSLTANAVQTTAQTPPSPIPAGQEASRCQALHSRQKRSPLFHPDHSCAGHDNEEFGMSCRGIGPVHPDNYSYSNLCSNFQRYAESPAFGNEYFSRFSLSMQPKLYSDPVASVLPNPSHAVPSHVVPSCEDKYDAVDRLGKHDVVDRLGKYDAVDGLGTLDISKISTPNKKYKQFQCDTDAKSSPFRKKRGRPPKSWNNNNRIQLKNKLYIKRIKSSLPVEPDDEETITHKTIVDKEPVESSHCLEDKKSPADDSIGCSIIGSLETQFKNPILTSLASQPFTSSLTSQPFTSLDSVEKKQGLSMDEIGADSSLTDKLRIEEESVLNKPLHQNVSNCSVTLDSKVSIIVIIS